MGFSGATDFSIRFTFSTTTEDRNRIIQSFSRFNPEFSGSHIFKFAEVMFSLRGGSIVPFEICFGPDLKSLKPLITFDRGRSIVMAAALIAGGTGLELKDAQHLSADFNQSGPDHPFTELIQGVADLRDGFYHFEALRQGAPPSVPFGSTQLLEPTGVNLPAVLRHLDDNKPHLYQEIAQTLSNLVPDLGQLNFRSNDNVHEIVFDDPATPHLRQNLQNLGTGVEQLLLTLVVGIAQPQARTIVIEEPETALEAGAQRALLGLLQEWSKDRLFIVSTHSTAMIDWSAAASGLLYRVDRSKGRSRVNKVRGDFRVLLNALGVRLSDVVSAETVLVVEGSTDRTLLGIFCPKLLQTPSIAVVPGGGGDQARLAHILQEWMDAADTVGPRRIVFLRDRDELGADQQSELAKKGFVKFLPCREIENYLLDASALHRVLSEEQTLTASVEDIEAALRSAADGLKESVVLGRVWWQLPPIGLVTHDLRALLSEQGDKLNKLIAAACGVLPTREKLTGKINTLWNDAAQSVEAEWPSEWSSLVPGSTVLEKLYQRFLTREFDKDVDGSKIARALDHAPQDLVDLLSALI